MLLLHSLFQVILFYIIGPLPSNTLYAIKLIGNKLELFSNTVELIPNSDFSLEPAGFLLYSLYEVGFFTLLVIYQIVQYNKYLSTISSLKPQSKKYKIIPASNIVSLSQTVANKILHLNLKGVNIQHNELHLFSEARDGVTLLFFQDSKSTIPVAMNYSEKYPNRYAILSVDNPTQIMVPSTYQMNKFLEMVEELDLAKTN